MSNEEYIPTIGLEIHAELRTKSKMFCSCVNDPDEEKPNKNICPICLAHPGTLPVLNKEAIKNVIKIGIAVGGKIADFTEWDRKNYFYPDIPKGYQISQYKFPLVSDGNLAGVELERIHLEEDTAQSTHDTHQNSLINFNRSGVPLMELVTKPVIHDAKTAVVFAKELQLLLRYLNAGDANMEKGEMRVEANISVATKTDTKAGKFGTKTEVKNLNSFRSVERAIEYELKRQSSLLRNGDKVIQETRGWDDVKEETYSQRSKESSHDYRYFPDPDIPKLKISEIPEFSTNVLKKEIPELPWTKRERYKKEFGLTDTEVAIFVESPLLASYFEKIISKWNKDQKKIKLTVNYLLSDYLGLLKGNNNQDLASANNSPATIDSNDHDNLYNNSLTYGPMPINLFQELIEMIDCGELSSRGAKDLLSTLVNDEKKLTTLKNGKIQLKEFASERGFIQKSNESELEPIIKEIIASNQKVVAEYKSGKTTSLQYLIGQAMKATKGSANPEVIKRLLLSGM